jgi:hypothetical protein
MQHKGSSDSDISMEGEKPSEETGEEIGNGGRLEVKKSDYEADFDEDEVGVGVGARQQADYASLGLTRRARRSLRRM